MVLKNANFYLGNGYKKGGMTMKKTTINDVHARLKALEDEFLSLGKNREREIVISWDSGLKYPIKMPMKRLHVIVEAAKIGMKTLERAEMLDSLSRYLSYLKGEKSLDEEQFKEISGLLLEHHQDMMRQRGH